MRRLAPSNGIAIAVALLAAPATAEEAPDQIVVTGRGLAETPAAPVYNVQDISRDRLLEAASGRIEDSLSAAAGFQQFRRSDSRSSNPSAQGVTLRGLGGNATSRTLVLLDGVPMADPFFGYIPFSAIAPERLASARVTRGGGAGAFGAGAVAGTIELDSASADQLGLLGASLLANDRGETELSGTLAPRLGDGFVVISGRWDRGKGFWTAPTAQRDPLSTRARFDSWSTGARAVAPLALDIELQARVAAFEDHRTLRFTGADSSSSGQDGSLRLVGRGPWQFDVLGYVQARDFTNIVISSNPAYAFRKTLDQRATPSTGAGGKLELRPPVGGNHVLRIGGDWRIASGETIEDGYSTSTGAVTLRRRAGGRNSDIGLFAEDDWKLGALLLTAGGRADRWSISDGHFVQTTPSGTVVTPVPSLTDRSGWTGSFRGGAVATPAKGVALRASAYSGLRQPTLNELYRSFTVFPVITQANAQLKNERLEGYEAGFDITPFPALMLSATAFDNKIKNAIVNVTDPANANLRKRQNVGAVHARGLEFSAAIKTGTITLDGSLAYTEAQLEASGSATLAQLDGKRPAQTPRWAASTTLAWRPAPRWDMAVTLRHVGAQYEDDLQTNILPAATTIDAYARMPLTGAFSLILRGENLTDETIVTRNQSGSMDTGTPRTFWAGIRVEVR